MTIRDYFAAIALQGLLSSEGDDSKYTSDSKGDRYVKAAVEAYDHADAMIKVRGHARD